MMHFAIAMQEAADLIRAFFVLNIGLTITMVLAITSLIRGEKLLLPIIALSITPPILVYWVLILLFSKTFTW